MQHVARVSSQNMTLGHEQAAAVEVRELGHVYAGRDGAVISWEPVDHMAQGFRITVEIAP